MAKNIRTIPAKEGHSIFLEVHLDAEIKGAKALQAELDKALVKFNKAYRVNLESLTVHSGDWKIDHKNKPVFVVFSNDLDKAQKEALRESKRYKMEYLVSLFQDNVDASMASDKLVSFESPKATEKAFKEMGLDLDLPFSDLIKLI